jgi:hypothetical protein
VWGAFKAGSRLAKKWRTIGLQPLAKQARLAMLSH